MYSIHQYLKTTVLVDSWMEACMGPAAHHLRLGEGDNGGQRSLWRFIFQLKGTAFFHTLWYAWDADDGRQPISFMDRREAEGRRGKVGEASRSLFACRFTPSKTMGSLCTSLKQVLADDISILSVTFFPGCQKVRQEFPRFQTENSLLQKSLSWRNGKNCNL